MDAIIAAVDARLTGLEFPFYDGSPPTGANLPPNRYGVWYLSLPNGRNPRSSGDRGSALVMLSILYRGKSADGCRKVAAVARAALDGVRLIDGGEPIHLEGTQVRPDDNVNPPEFVATDVARFHVPTHLLSEEP